MANSRTILRAKCVSRSILLLCATLALSATVRFASFDFPLLGVTDTEATAITPSGIIVGRYFTPDGQGHGFRLADGHFQSIDVPGATSSTDVAWINSRGDIVGSYNVGSTTYAYVLRSGQLTTIGYPGAQFTFGFGISNAGDVVGTEFTDNFFAAHGYLFRQGTFTLIDVPNAQATWPTMAIDSRRIVGTYFGPDSLFHGFLLREGQFTTIDFPGSTFTWITGINPEGHIVGFYNSQDDFRGPCPIRESELWSKALLSQLQFRVSPQEVQLAATPHGPSSSEIGSERKTLLLRKFFAILRPTNERT